jgi:hypothetical protein
MVKNGDFRCAVASSTFRRFSCPLERERDMTIRLYQIEYNPLYKLFVDKLTYEILNYTELYIYNVLSSRYTSLSYRPIGETLPLAYLGSPALPWRSFDGLLPSDCICCFFLCAFSLSLSLSRSPLPENRVRTLAVSTTTFARHRARCRIYS